MRPAGAAVLLLLLAALAGCATAPSPPDSGGACARCFWKYHPESLRLELIEHYERVRIADPLVDAERELLLARVTEDHERLCRAHALFAELAGDQAPPQRRALAAESAALLADECGAPSRPAFRAASRACAELGEDWRAALYEAASEGEVRPRFGEPPPLPGLVAPPGATAVVLGESRLEIHEGTRIGTQLERVLRDWLSAQLRHDGVSPPSSGDVLLDWHEGHQLRVLAGHSGPSIVPLGRGLAARRGDRWFGADENGVFRFEILPDKTQYPTTRHGADLALLADTHGFSALVAPAAGADVDLVVACGDSRGKMHAALSLARQGVDAYFPCDRFVGLVLGYDAPGTLIGSAPISLDAAGRATIGDRPITLWRHERVVVQDAPGVGEVRYCDAPRRYFERLSEAFPLELEVVTVRATGQAVEVVDRAFETGARAIAVRVSSEEDATPVLAWLDASDKNRAILFHSASYPAGRRVFEAFPRRTSFGDPRPRFLSVHDGS